MMMMIWQVKERPLTLVNAHVVTPRTDQVRDGKHHNGMTAPDPLNSLASVIEKKLPGRSGSMYKLKGIILTSKFCVIFSKRGSTFVN